jgi:hypothetical protein
MGDAAVLKELNKKLMGRLRETQAELKTAIARIAVLEARSEPAERTPGRAAAAKSPALSTPAHTSALPPTSPASTDVSASNCEDRPSPPPGPRFGHEGYTPVRDQASAENLSWWAKFMCAVHAVVARIVSAFRVLTGAATAVVPPAVSCGEHAPLLPVHLRVAC